MPPQRRPQSARALRHSLSTEKPAAGNGDDWIPHLSLAGSQPREHYLRLPSPMAIVHFIGIPARLKKAGGGVADASTRAQASTAIRHDASRSGVPMTPPFTLVQGPP